MDKILITGSSGQLGTELTVALSKIYGEKNVIAADIHKSDKEEVQLYFELLDVIDKKRLAEVVDIHKITQIYHLAAILSATGEKHPGLAWRVNIDGLMNVLDVSREKSVKKVYWPSSIAVFGPQTPKKGTPQYTVTDPNTVYGISKLTGERLIEYYNTHYGLDVRSVRYPGLIGYKTLPGGGTTDYAVDIYYKAIKGSAFECFLKEDTYLPMMYMPDAVRGTLELMEAEASRIRIRSSYNLSSMSFSPKEIYEEVKKHYPGFAIRYVPDFRQQIAESWPEKIDDSPARYDWGWKDEYDLAKMTNDMLDHLRLSIIPGDNVK
jgi:nucleoside-diphosphate-sugar epimerase